MATASRSWLRGARPAPLAGVVRRPAAARTRRRELVSRLALEALFAAGVLLAAARFVTLHLASTIVHPPASLALLCAGEGEIPYQYRALVPWLVDRIALRLPDGGGDPRQAIAVGFEVASVVALCYAVRALVAPLVRPPLAAAASALLVFHALGHLYVLPEAWPFWYPSDLPSVALFAGGLLALRSGRWVVYYPLFALATLNRETACFLTIVHVLTRLDPRRLGALAAHVAAQTAIWAAIKLGLAATYDGNPGVGGWDRGAWSQNLISLREPRTWLLLASSFGFLWIPLAAFGHRIADAFARRALLVLPVMLAAGLRLAVVDELRIYGEGIPLVVLGLVALAAGRLRPGRDLGRFAAA